MPIIIANSKTAACATLPCTILCPQPKLMHLPSTIHTHTSTHTRFKIRFLLLQNRQGKTRLSKWYVPPPTEAEKFRLEADVHKLIVSRDRKYTNFVEYQSYKLIYRRYAGLYFSLGVDVTDNELAYLESIHLFVELLDEFFRNVCELDIVFNFNKVRGVGMGRGCLMQRGWLSKAWFDCAADIRHYLRPRVFRHSRPYSLTNPARTLTQVYSILDEFILAGEIQETSKREILERIRDMQAYEKASEK